MNPRSRGDNKYGYAEQVDMKMLFNEIASHNISKILECTQALGDKIELRVKGGLL